MINICKCHLKRVQKYNKHLMIRDKFQFFHSLGITKIIFLDDLESYRTDILHFSGHGTEYSSLVFQDGDELVQ